MTSHESSTGDQKLSTQVPDHRQRDSYSGDGSVLGFLKHHAYRNQPANHNNIVPEVQGYQNQQIGHPASSVHPSGHHPILRVASAHGSRDCVHLLPLPNRSPLNSNASGQSHQSAQRNASIAALTQQQIAMSRAAQYHQSVVDPFTTSNVAITSGHQQFQAINAPDQAKYGAAGYRRSPESTRAVQAVTPFASMKDGSSGASGTGSGEANTLPTDIPNECQVVKQLMREVVANQLAMSSSSNNACSTTPPAPPLDPPAYSSHHPRADTVPTNRQIATSTTITTGQRHVTESNTIGQSEAAIVSVNQSQAELATVAAPSEILTTTKMHPLLAAQQASQNGSMTSSAVFDNVMLQSGPSHFTTSPNEPGQFQQTSSFSTRQLAPESSLFDPSTYLQYLQLQQQRQQRHLLENVQHGQNFVPNPSPNNNNSMALDFLDQSQRGSSGIIAVLADENKKLRLDLESSFKKALKLHQLELQYQKISRDYEELVRKQEKREQLEQQVHRKMQVKLADLDEANNSLTDQLELYYSQMDQYQAENVELQQELARLASQNKELFAIKERQEIELEAQRATLEEQRAHIVILDKALTNAQEKVLKLDEECKKRSALAQRNDQLQQEVNTLRDAVQKRDDLYKRNVAQLQKELAELRLQKKDTNKKSTSSELEDVSVAKLKRELQEKDKQIYNFQQESEQWRKLYNDEVERKSFALDEMTDAKNARIKVLEETNEKSEKRADELENKLNVEKARYNILKRQSQSCIVTNSASLVSESSYDNRTSKSSLFGGTSDIMDGSKKRLEAAHRLLQSPSIFHRQHPHHHHHHGKFAASLDAGLLDATSAATPAASRRATPSCNRRATAGLLSSKMVAAAAASLHGRASSSCDATASTLSERFAASPFAPRELRTLPHRRSRAQVPLTETGPKKLNRPRSADDHLFSLDDQQELLLEKLDSKNRISKKNEKNEIVKEDEGNDFEEKFESGTVKRNFQRLLPKKKSSSAKKEKSGDDEELFDV